MLIDHVAAIFPISSQYSNIMRGIGRISFPIFAFVLVEGFYHTRDRKRYMLRLLTFALITELFFNLAISQNIFYPWHQNVLFTFLISLFVLDRIDKEQNQNLSILWIIGGCLGALLFSTDYSAFGVLMVVLLWKYRGNFTMIALMLLLVNTLLALFSTPIQHLGLLAIPILFFYNGRKGYALKYFFYAFYPIHLLLLYLLYVFIY